MSERLSTVQVVSTETTIENTRNTPANRTFRHLGVELPEAKGERNIMQVLRAKGGGSGWTALRGRAGPVIAAFGPSENPTKSALHEVSHAASAEGGIMNSQAFREGGAEYYSRQMAAEAGAPGPSRYPDQEAVYAELCRTLGEQTMANAFFGGRTDAFASAFAERYGGTEVTQQFVDAIFEPRGGNMLKAAQIVGLDYETMQPPRRP